MVLAYSSHSQVFFPTRLNFFYPSPAETRKGSYKDPVERDDTLTSEVIPGGSVDERPSSVLKSMASGQYRQRMWSVDFELAPDTRPSILLLSY